MHNGQPTGAGGGGGGGATVGFTFAVGPAVDPAVDPVVPAPKPRAGAADGGSGVAVTGAADGDGRDMMTAQVPSKSANATLPMRKMIATAFKKGPKNGGC